MLRRTVHPAFPAWTSGSLARSALQYRRVVEQFEVERAVRYQSEDPLVRGAVFVWDVSRAMSCEIPAAHLCANDLALWLPLAGKEQGWARCRDAKHAGVRAQAGFPTLAVWQNPNPDGAGLTAVVIPSDLHPVAIAMAGERCLFDVPVEAGFGELNPHFYTHD